MTATATDQLIRTYTARKYCYTTMVNHKGTVIAFAMDEDRRIYYAVLDISSQDRGYLDVNYWPEDPQPLLFPYEIEQVGYSIAGTTPMPTVKKGSRIEAQPGEIQPEEMDGFLSSTARLTANAPFQVLSDNKHIFVFRQSVGKNDPDMVFKLLDGKASGDPNRPDTDYLIHQGEKLPIVQNTLLCDRFILAGSELRQKIEIRYRRSRHRTQPAGANDSMGPKDMEGNFFFEPTQELDFVKNLNQGNFTVLQLPTQVSGVKRWQIFSHNSLTDRIDSYNLEVSKEGLFNPAGTQLYTSPDPEYQSSVLEREPGTCPFTKEPLIPMVNKANQAESGLHFNGENQQHIDCGTAPEAASLTLEAWIFPENVSGVQTIAERYNHVKTANLKNGFCLSLAEGKLQMEVHHGAVGLHHQIATQDEIKVGEWTHLAGTWDQVTGVLALYVNGFEQTAEQAEVQEGIAYNPKTPFFIGGSPKSTKYFTGLIDEVRLWKRALDGEEIAYSKSLRLTGDEPALEGYWRLDEGGGTTAYDQTDHAYHGTLVNNPEWIASDAPLGDHPGIQKSSFLVETPEDAAIDIQTLLLQQQTTTETTIKQKDSVAKVLSLGDGFVQVDVEEWTSDRFCVEMWVKAIHTNQSEWTGLFSTCTASGSRTNSFQIDFDAKGRYRFLHDHDQYDQEVLIGLATPYWQHLAVSYDGVKVKTYLNGALVNEVERSLQASFQNYMLGCNRGNNFLFEGQMDEVRIWNRPRTQEELQTHKNQRLLGNEPGLVGYYRFDEGSEDQVRDISTT